VARLSKDPVTRLSQPVLRCANKEYLLVSFISLLDGNRLHELDVDFEEVQDWAELANKIGVPPCNVPGLTWENVVSERKIEL